MPAGVDFFRALAGPSRRLRIRPADLDRAHAHAVQRNLLQLRLSFVEPLSQLRDAFGRGVRWWRELLPRRLLTPGWTRTAIARRQSFVNARNRDGQPVFPRRQSHAELRRLPAEILAILIEPRGALWIVDQRRHLSIVHPQRHRDWFGASRTHAAENHADNVFPFDRNTMHGVKRVRDAQAGAIVLCRKRSRIARPPAVGSELGQRRREHWRSKDRKARDPVGRRHVFLHERRRERQHVADVVEAVARVILREVVGWTLVDSQQIADRVVVFRAVQPSRSDVSGIRRGQSIDPREFTRQPSGHRLPLMLRRLRLIVGWHLPVTQLQHDLVPAIAIVD